MKKIILACLSVIFIGTVSVAQNATKKTDSKTEEVKPLPNSWRTQHAGQTSLLMKGGKMMVWENNMEKPMVKEMTLDNGTSVFMDGSWKAKDGKNGKLKNGECIDMTGKITPIEAGNTKKNTTATPSKTDK